MRQEEDMGKKPFFGLIGSDLSTSSLKSLNSNSLVSTHPIGKLKIVLESLRSIEDMVKNQSWDFECFTSGNPCDSSPPLKGNFWPGTPEKFSEHGFSFFHQNLPFSLESRSKWLIGCLIYQNLKLASNTNLELEVENFLSHEEVLVKNPYLANFYFNFGFHAQNNWLKISRVVCFTQLQETQGMTQIFSYDLNPLPEVSNCKISPLRPIFSQPTSFY